MRAIKAFLSVFVLCSAYSTLSYAAGTACTLTNIEIKSMRAGFSNKCRTRTCMAFEGIAALKNKCSEAVGVQIKITAYAKNGSPLATRELWPASIRNIPPGDFEFSLDTWLDYQPGMHKFALSVVDVKRW
jgi:hypothetical protein